MTTRCNDNDYTIAPLQYESKPCYSYLSIASLHMKIWSIEEEADRLAKRFRGVNRAAFARDYGISGGQSMIYQHITGRRPISPDAAQAYARGFGCALEDISPRLAEEARKAARSLGEVEAEGDEGTLTKEQKQVLSIMASIRKEALEAWLKVGGYLSAQMPERRKKDVEHHPGRRTDDIPPDPHDLRNHEPEFDDDDDQSEERETK